MIRILWLVDRPLGARCLEFASASSAAEICGVVSTPDGATHWWGQATFHRWATARGLPWFDASAVSRAVEETKPDLLVSVLFTRRVPSEIVRRIRSINLHCAPLPAYAGSNATLWAVLNEERRFGATLHEMSDRFDEGPIVETGGFDVPAGVTNAELYALAHEDGFQLLSRSFERLVVGAYVARPQSGSRRSFQRVVLPSRELDPSMDSATVARLARAFHFPPFEPAYLTIEGRRYHVIPAPAAERPGSSVHQGPVPGLSVGQVD